MTPKTLKTTSAASAPESGFSYHRDFFEGLVDSALAHAKKMVVTAKA